MAITRPKVGGSTPYESTNPRTIAMEKIINDLPKDQQKLFREDPELRKKLKEIIVSEGYISPKKIKELSKSSQEARERKDVKGITTTKLTEVVVKPKPSSVKDVAPLGGSSYKIKKGDTLSAIARRNNTTVAALMRMNPKIEDKDEIRAGQFIKIGSPKRAAGKTKSTKDLRGDPTSVAEAKRRGMDYYVVINSKGEEVKKAAVTADELKKSGLSLRAYLNKMKKKKKMDMGGMLSSQRRQPTTSATGLSGMNMGGMKKKTNMIDYRKTGMFRK